MAHSTLFKAMPRSEKPERPRVSLGGLDGWVQRKPTPKLQSSPHHVGVPKQEQNTSPPADMEHKSSHVDSSTTLDHPPGKAVTPTSPKKRSRAKNGSEPSTPPVTLHTELNEDELPRRQRVNKRVKLQESSDEDTNKPVPVVTKPSVPAKGAARGSSGRGGSKLDRQPSSPETSSHLPLTGKRIVLTGVFESCSRDEMVDHIKRNGGSCTSAVSGLTDILVTGVVLEDNRPIEEGKKYQKAQQLQTEGRRNSKLQIMTEAAFLALVPLNTKSPTDAPSAPSPQSAVEGPTPGQTSEDIQGPPSSAAGSLLWTEKWRPQSTAEVMGNGDVVKKLTAWLQDWHDVCILGHLKKPTAKATPRLGGRFPEAERVNARAAMLSGPPGIGKTSMAKVVARECGYDIVEYNASDDRGKIIVDIISDMASGGTTLLPFMDRNTVQKKTILVMDEMDGLSRGDRGGAQALMKLIEKSQCPVICICNDRYNPKLRALAAKCYDLVLHKPPKNVIAKRICELVRREGLSAEYNAVELLCERVGNDLRQIINALQLMARSTKSITYDMMRQEIGRGLKDGQVMDSVFDVCRKLLSKVDSAKMSFNDKLYGYFTDYDMVPLYMEENYLGAFANSLGKQRLTPEREAEAFTVMSHVSDCFSLADMMNRKCRRDGYWSLLGDIGLFSAIVPACQASGFVTFPEFPKWLGRNSTTSKNKRLLNELQLFISPYSSVTPSAMQVSGYVDVLYNRILEPLLMAEHNVSTQDAVAEALNRMNSYGLSRDHVVEHMASLRFKSQENTYDLVESSVKRTLTTTANSMVRPVRIAPPPSIRKRDTTAAAGLFAAQEGEGAPDDVAPAKENEPETQEAPDEDDGLVDRLIDAKKKKRKAPTGTAPPLAATTCVAGSSKSAATKKPASRRTAVTKKSKA